MRRFLLLILVLLFVTSLYGQDAETVATETRIAKQSSTEDGDRGLFTVPSVETLNKNQYSFGYAWSGANRSPRDVSVSSLPAYFSYGVLGKLTVTGTFDTDRQVTAHNLAQPGYNTAYPFISQHFSKGYGDTLIAGKYRFRRTRDNIGGLAFRSFVKVGTADVAKGLGTGKTDVGADFIFSSLLPWKFSLTSDLGYVSVGNAKDPVTGGTRRLKNEIRSGLGTAWPADGLNLSAGTLQGIFEYSTVSFVGGGTSNAANSLQNWRDVAVGVRFLMLDHGITLHAGYRTNTKVDLKFPGNERRQGFTFSVSYTKPVRPPGKNSYPVVALETSSDSIPVGGSATITATGYDADKDELKYSWSASGGQIVGSGTAVTFNATGIAPGTYTVRVTASDGKGGTATSLIEVMVKQ